MDTSLVPKTSGHNFTKIESQFIPLAERRWALDSVDKLKALAMSQLDQEYAEAMDWFMKSQFTVRHMDRFAYILTRDLDDFRCEVHPEELRTIQNLAKLAMLEVWQRCLIRMEGDETTCNPSNDWIDQARVKPKIGEFVIGLGVSSNIFGDVDICTWDGTNWWCEGGTELTDQVTHWSPIPPRPAS